MDSINQYYGRESVLQEMLDSVSDPGHRVWKVIDLDGTCRQNKKKINNIKKLREFIGDQPGKVFVSVGKWMQPERVYGKNIKRSHYLWDDNIFLGSDLWFDFDCEENEKLAYDDACEMKKAMDKEKEYSLEYMSFSGTKGYHLVYKDLKPIREKDPIKRLKRTEQRRKDLLKRLPSLETLDQLSSDQYRVFAVVGSVKSKTGYKVEKIHTNKVVRRKPMIERPLRSTPTYLSREEGATLTSKGQLQGKGCSSSITYPLNYKFVDNYIHGCTDMLIPILMYKKLKKCRDDVIFLQRKYNLGNFYIFSYKNIFLGVCLTPCNFRRLSKIMKKSRCLNYRSFVFYGHTWLPISNTYDSEGRCIREKPKLFGVIKSDKKTVISRPHARLLGLKGPLMYGKPKNKVYKAVVIKGDLDG